MKKERGISLIVLIITIVVIIILAATVVLTLGNNNPIENAKKAVFLNDVSNFKDQLYQYIGQQYIDTQGEFQPNSLPEKLERVLTDLPEKYENKFGIDQNGQIFGRGEYLTEQEKEWLIGILEIKYKI